MSDYLQPRLYNGRALENQLRNLMHCAHDTCCGCNTPKEHLIHILEDKRCVHTTSKETTATPGVATGETEEINGEDLERLFAATDDDEG